MLIYSFFDEDSVNITFSNDEMGIFSVGLNNIYDDDVNFDEDETVIHVRLMAWRNIHKQYGTFKKDISPRLMPLAYSILQDGGIGACQKMRKKEQNQYSLIKISKKLKSGEELAKLGQGGGKSWRKW